MPVPNQDFSEFINDVSVAFPKLPPTNRMVKVMPLGDSITYGYGDNKDDPYIEGYRYRLRESLVGHYAPLGVEIVFVGSQGQKPNFHQGTGGKTAKNLIADKPWKLYRPDIITLLIGVNDLSALDSPATAFASITTLVTNILTDNPFTKIFIGSLVPYDPTGVASITAINLTQQKILDLNLLIPTLDNGLNIIFVDLFSVVTLRDMQKVPGDTAVTGTDGLHPSNRAYRKMAAKFYTTIIQRPI